MQNPGQSSSDALDELERKVKQYECDPRYPHDSSILICIEESIAAAREGNFAVGSCLVDADGNVVERGHNHVPGTYRSDLHAEMAVMTQFEERTKGAVKVRDYTIFSSLEPCPMCTIRLITAGVGHVFWAADDVETGMMRTLDRLTPGWVAMTHEQEFGSALCSPELKDWGWQVFLVTANMLAEKSKRTAQVYLSNVGQP
jgi:tRNA(Arg) A34 adenosine deaminase TadA